MLCHRPKNPRASRNIHVAVGSFFIALLAVCFSVCSVAQEPALSPPTRSIDEKYFGMHMHQPGIRGGWPNVKFGSRRLWDAYVAWPNIEPKVGDFDFRALDSALNEAERRKVSVVLPLGLSPAWASARPNEPSGYKPGNAAEPISIESWGTYVAAVASRYKGRIEAYEVWNEPDLKMFFSGTPEKMAELTNEACRQIRKIDKSALIVGPAPTSGPHTFGWYRKFLKASGDRPCYDIVGWHLYTTEGTPETMVEVSRRIRALLNEFGLSKMPIWNTEYGYFIENRAGARVTGTVANPSKLILDEDLAGSYLARAFIVGWAAGIERLYWYAWDNGKMGLIEPMGFAEKPAVNVYRRIHSWLLGTRFTSCTRARGVFSCMGQRGGDEMMFVWSVGAGQGVELPEGWQAAKVERIDGRELQLKRNDLLDIDGRPQRLVRATGN